MSDCIFCKIINGEIPSQTIYEDDEFKVILDAFPASKGHALVLPKQHYANIYALPTDVAGRLFALAQKVAKAMENLDGLVGLNVLQNNGTKAGQTVFHFHMHLIPRFEDDGITIKWNNEKYADGEIEEVKSRILEYMDK